MQNDRDFKISCPTFGGYTTRLAVNDFDSLDEVVAAVLDQLKASLLANNFESLLHTLENEIEKYHIHDASLESILISVDNKPLYICNHGCRDVPDKAEDMDLDAAIGIPMTQLDEDLLVQSLNDTRSPADDEDDDASETTSLL